MNFERSGLLNNESSQERRRWIEPIDACLPVDSPIEYRLFVFKGEEQVGMFVLQGKSYFTIGRNEQECDFVALHPSVSSKHAVIQFRRIFQETTKEPTDPTIPPQSKVLPFLVDVASANGTLLNGSRLEPNVYYELKSGDVLNIGASTRDYVLMGHEDKK